MKSVLAIEIAPHVVNIIEGVHSRQPKIINFIQIPNPPQTPEALSQKIAQVLKEKNIQTKATFLAVYSPQMEQRYVQVPILSKKELEQVVKREVSKSKEKLRCELNPEEGATAGTDKKSCEMYSDHQLMGETEVQKVKKKGLILAAAPQKLIDDYARILSGAELLPQQIINAPLALANSLPLVVSPVSNALQPTQDNVGFLHLMPDRGWLVIISQGVWRFFREFPIPKNSADDTGAENTDYGQLVLEVSRSLLYFNQQERGRQVSWLAVSSNREISRDTINYFVEKLQLPISVFDPAEKLNLSGLTAPPEGWPAFLNPWSVPLGLLLESHLQITVNLLPLKVRAHKQRLAGGVLIGLGVAVYVISLGAAYFGLRWARDNYRQAMERNEQSLAPFKSAAAGAAGQNAEQLIRLRDFQLSVLKRFERASPLWRGAFYELGHMLPVGMVLSAMDFSEVEDTWEFKLEGIISADTSVQAQQLLAEFMANLEKAVFFQHSQIVEVNIIPYKSGEDEKETGGTKAPTAEVQLNFSLTGGIVF